MLVIAKDTEKILFRELRTCWAHFPTHRCLQLKFSKLELDKEEWFDKVIQALRSYLDDKSAQFYLCHDNDVFVITRTMTHKRVAEFLAHLSPQLAPAPLTELAVLFEIGVDWSRLREICRKKMEALALIKSQKQAQRQEELARISREKALNTLSHDLIDTLSVRRAERERPEVMIVEDDPFSQKLVSNALKSKYAHSITGDGQGALMNYVNKAPDVLFLDIGLPDINGHEVLKKLFEIDPDAYVVMFSGNGDKDNIMKAVELGAKGFVGKPFTQEKLLQYIQKSPFIQAKQKQETLHGNPNR